MLINPAFFDFLFLKLLHRMEMPVACFGTSIPVISANVGIKSRKPLTKFVVVQSKIFNNILSRFF